MKKLILALVLALTATSAMAQYRGGYSSNRSVTINHYSYNRGYYGGYHGGCYGCAVGAGIIAGTIIGSALAAPPVIVSPPPVYVYPTPPIPLGYHYTTMMDPACNCLREVLVPN